MRGNIREKGEVDEIIKKPCPYSLRVMKHSVKKSTIHQVTTMLSTSRNVLFPGPNHLLKTGADDLTLARAPARSEGSSVLVVLAGG